MRCDVTRHDATQGWLSFDCGSTGADRCSASNTLILEHQAAVT
jgi:hypothetical protein